jgi:hypothetical protein
MSKDIKVGPDGTGSYRYEVNGVGSVAKYHNAASARRAAQQTQVVVSIQGTSYLAPVDSPEAK